MPFILSWNCYCDTEFSHQEKHNHIKKKILCLIVQSFFPKFSLASSLYTFLSLPLIFLFLQLLAPLINITSSWSGILIIKYVSLPFP